jgi:hypothetical protein
VQCHRAGHFDFGRAIQWQVAVNLLKCEAYLGKSLAFQDLAMHFSVAAFVAGICACRIHDKTTGSCSRLRVEVDGSGFQGETAVDGMHHGIEREFDRALRGVKLEL